MDMQAYNLNISLLKFESSSYDQHTLNLMTYHMCNEKVTAY